MHLLRQVPRPNISGLTYLLLYLGTHKTQDKYTLDDIRVVSKPLMMALLLTGLRSVRGRWNTD